MHIATAEKAPPAAPFGLFPAGTYWMFTPSGLQFKGPVTMTLPAPAGLSGPEMFIGHWTGTEWVDLDGALHDGLITAQTTSFSTFAAFCGKLGDYRPVLMRNDSSSPTIHITYISGPSPDPANPEAFAAGCPSPAVVEHTWDLEQGGVAPFHLRAGLYHLVVSYPQPQPGIANSLFLTLSPGEKPLMISIGDKGAAVDDPSVTVQFAGNQLTAGSNARPIVAGTAVVPEGVAMASLDPGAAGLPSRIVEIGPIKLEQFAPKGPGIQLSASATDPEGKSLQAIWTVNDGKSHNVVAGETVASGAPIPDAAQFKPTVAGDYTIFLTVYDDLGLFDEMRWIVHVEANAKPQIAAVSGRTHVEFGRLDAERAAGVGAIQPMTATVRPGTALPVQVPSLSAPGTTVSWNPATLCPSVLSGPFSALPETGTVVNAPSPVDALEPFAPPDVTNRWVNPGRTCVWALVYEPDNDPVTVEWEMPEPLYGEGTFYAAVDVPAGFHADAPQGIQVGTLLSTYAQLDAYNAWVAALFNVAGVVPAVVWEAWDDPCLTGDGVQSPCESALSRGGLTNIVAQTSDGFSTPSQVGYASILVGPEAYESDCSHVMFFAELRPNPSDPGPGQDVWVHATLAPMTEACPVNFTIVGTDSYANAATIWTNKDGEARFFVPGGAESVVDVVTANICIPLTSLETPPAQAEQCTTQDGKPGKLLGIEVTYTF